MGMPSAVRKHGDVVNSCGLGGTYMGTGASIWHLQWPVCTVSITERACSMQVQLLKTVPEPGWPAGDPKNMMRGLPGSTALQSSLREWETEEAQWPREPLWCLHPQTPGRLVTGLGE